MSSRATLNWRSPPPEPSRAPVARNRGGHGRSAPRPVWSGVRVCAAQAVYRVALRVAGSQTWRARQARRAPSQCRPASPRTSTIARSRAPASASSAITAFAARTRSSYCCSLSGGELRRRTGHPRRYPGSCASGPREDVTRRDRVERVAVSRNGARAGRSTVGRDHARRLRHGVRWADKAR
jgi:hypothetical protein